MEPLLTFSQPLGLPEAIQFGDRRWGCRRLAPELKCVRGLEPEPIGSGKRCLTFAAQQAGPGFEVHLKQPLLELGA